MMLQEHAPVLVVAAHHDDETLGCGGTIARLAAKGHPVTVTVLGQGTVSRDPDLGSSDQQGVLERMKAQAKQAAQILGATFVQAGRFPDNAFDSVPLLDIVRSVETMIETVKPQLILTHYAGDLNIDHRVTSQAVQTAARPMPGSFVRTILTFEVLSSTEWAPQGSPPFNPNVFFDVTESLELKIEAMRCYFAELNAFPHPRSKQGIRLLAGMRGMSSGVQAAEGFALVRTLAGQEHGEAR